jgi:hypothetical protein
MLGIGAGRAAVLDGDYYPLTPIHRTPSQWVPVRLSRKGARSSRYPPAGMQAGNTDRISQATRPDAVYLFENPSGDTKKLTGQALERDGFTFYARALKHLVLQRK